MDVHPSSSVRALQNNWEVQKGHDDESSNVHRRAEKEIGGGNIARHVIKSSDT